MITSMRDRNELGVVGRESRAHGTDLPRHSGLRVSVAPNALALRQQRDLRNDLVSELAGLLADRTPRRFRESLTA
jgi:hypothetical protein